MKKYLLLIILLLPFTVLAKGYEIVSGDLDTIGSIVKIAGEEFYVLGREDSTHVKLFSRYNLALGYGYDENTYRQDPKSEEYIYDMNPPDGMRVGYYADGVRLENPKGGIMAFDNIYWYDSVNKVEKEGYGPAYVYMEQYQEKVFNIYDENSLLKAHVDKYVDYLNDTACVKTEGRLIEAQEMKELGFGWSCVYCDYTVMRVTDSTPDWLLNTQYWVGSASIANNYSGQLLTYRIKSNNNGVDKIDIRVQAAGFPQMGAGLRPVIILDTSVEGGCPVEEVKEDKEEVKGVEEIEENPPTGMNYYYTGLSIVLAISLMFVYIKMYKQSYFIK